MGPDATRLMDTLLSLLRRKSQNASPGVVEPLEHVSDNPWIQSPRMRIDRSPGAGEPLLSASDDPWVRAPRMQIVRNPPSSDAKK